MDFDKDIELQIIKFNRLFKNYDEVYQDLDPLLGLNKIQTGVLYTIEEFRLAGLDICTQKDITDVMLYSKQSINGAVTSLRKEGYIELKDIVGNKKSKNIVLTEKGLQYVEKEIDSIVLAENRAFKRLGNTDRRELLFLFEEITKLLNEELNKY